MLSFFYEIVFIIRSNQPTIKSKPPIGVIGPKNFSFLPFVELMTKP